MSRQESKVVMQIQQIINEIKTVFVILETDTSSADESATTTLVAKRAKTIHNPETDVKRDNQTLQGTHIQKHNRNLRCA